MMAAVRSASESDRQQVMASLVAAFITDPVTRWCWPEPKAYFTNSARFFDAYGGRAFGLDCAWVDEENCGGALWLPPGEGPDEEALGAVVMSTVPTDKQHSVFAALEELGTYHPQEPHWFLPVIGVDPSRQGCGIGSELMRHAVAKCDATGCRAYLESSNPRNIPLYERHGFRVIGRVELENGPALIPMLRDPQ